MKKNIAVCAALIVSFFVSVLITPTKLIANDAPNIDLESMIPKQFGEWKMDEVQAGFVVSPDIQGKLDLIYNQTLSRTYVNSIGERIMLAIAYGGDQSRALQVHKPETCYKSQGFSVETVGDGKLEFGGVPIKIRYLIATNGRRVEPITYWIRVAGTTVYGGMEQTLKRFELGIKGYIPDGMLVRVSNINSDRKQAYSVQVGFIEALLSSIDSSAKGALIGSPQLL